MPEIEKTEEEWRAALTPDQYAVLREAGTERPWSGKYVDCHDDGTYHCAACGAALFDASTKFESGSGWPSFYEPKVAEAVGMHARLSPHKTGARDLVRSLTFRQWNERSCRLANEDRAALVREELPSRSVRGGFELVPEVLDG